jgi:hypothetical protein
MASSSSYGGNDLPVMAVTAKLLAVPHPHIGKSPTTGLVPACTRKFALELWQ